MKLAEALHLRADLQKRIEQLRSRLTNNAYVQEGDEPAEDPKMLLAELDADTAELARLITAINLTNSRTVSDGKTLTAMIAEKDTLALGISLRRDLIAAASNRFHRHSSSDIRICSSINVREEQKKLDSLSKTLRELDVKIQGLNWTTDLIE